jgi:hypothetical protein
MLAMFPPPSLCELSDGCVGIAPTAGINNGCCCSADTQQLTGGVQRQLDVLQDEGQRSFKYLHMHTHPASLT